MAEVARSHRYELRFQAAFDDGEVYQTGPVRDLSTTGCFIETDAPLPAGRKLRVIPLTTGDDELCELVGEVARVEDRGMGVRFLPMDDDVEIRVIKFCEKRAAPAKTVPKKAPGKKLPAAIVPGVKPAPKKARPSPVDTADIIPLNTAEVRALDLGKRVQQVEDNHDEKLRETLNSIEGEPVAEPAPEPKPAPAPVKAQEPVVIERVIERVVEAPRTNPEEHDELLAFGPRRSWGWAAWLLAGGAAAGAAFYGVQGLEETQRLEALEDDAARALVAHARDRARALDAKLAGLAVEATPASPAPLARISLRTATVPGGDKEIAVHLGVELENPGAEAAPLAFERVSFYLGVLKGRAQPLRTLNGPGEEGPVAWSRVQRVATGDPELAKMHAVDLDAEQKRSLAPGEAIRLDQDLLVTPGKASFVAAEVELGVGDKRLRRVELTPVP